MGRWGTEVTWSGRDENAGSITPSGLLTAGEVAGSFEGTIEAQLTEGVEVVEQPSVPVRLPGANLYLNPGTS